MTRILVLAALLATTASPAFADGTENAADVNGITLRYLSFGEAGDMPIVYLIHGWPETADAWQDVGNRLAAMGYHVIAPDLRGFGGSSKPDTGYDSATLAADMNALATSLGHDDVAVVGHDMGLTVAYAWAAEYPGAVNRLVLMEMVVPGFGTEALARDMWHFGFFQAVPLAEMIASGRETEFLSFFYRNFSLVPGTFSEEDIARYAAAYAEPGALAASFGIYRELGVSAEQNRARLAEEGRLPMPVFAIGSALAVGDRVGESVSRVASDLRIEVLDEVGHFIGEENASLTANLIHGFLTEAD